MPGTKWPALKRHTVLPVARSQPVGPAADRGDEHEVPDDERRAGDGPDVAAPAQAAAARVVRVENAVARADVELPVGDRRRRVGEAAQPLRPDDPARGRVERDELARPRGHVEAPAVRRGARVEALVADEAPLHVGAPELGAVRSAQAEDRARVGRDADAVSPDGRARVDPAARVVGPANRGGRGVDREQAPVRRAEVDGVAEHDRGGLDLGGRVEPPERASVLAVQRGDRAVVRADEQALAGDRGRRGPVAAAAPPQDLARLGVERDGAPGLLRVRVDDAVADARRVLHEAADAPRPDRAPASACPGRSSARGFAGGSRRTPSSRARDPRRVPARARSSSSRWSSPRWSSRVPRRRRRRRGARCRGCPPGRSFARSA